MRNGLLSLPAILTAGFLSVFTGGLLLADGFIYVPEPGADIAPRPPGRRILPQRRRHFPLEVTKHVVKASIDGQVASTRVEETFHNPNGRQLEGVYIFPLPVDAAVSNFTMRIGGKEISGEVLQKDKARKIYQDIVRRAQDPGLLEYVDRGLFRASVFPIPARGNVEIAIEYSQSIKIEAGMSEYVYPLDTGKYSTGPYKNVVVDVSLNAKQSLRSIQCPSHEGVSIDRKGDKQARIGLEAKSLVADKDLIIRWLVSEDAIAPMLVTHRGHEREGFFYLSLKPRPESSEQVPPKDLIFVIDTSGSMTGRKMDQVKKALRYCVDGLNAQDRFNIVDFSTEARRFRPNAIDANEEGKKAAHAYIDQLKARGGTNIEEAMRYALDSKSADRLRLVVLLTDGEPTIGVTRPDELLKSIKDHNKSGQRVFVFGVGEDLNGKLLDAIVATGRGASEYIHGDENLEVPLSNFYDKVDSPVLTDLRVEFRGGSARAVYPKPIPDIFRGEQLDLFGRYMDDGFKTVVVHGKFLGQPRVFEYSLEFKGGKNEHVPQLWAVRAIGHLLEQIRLNGEKKEVKDEIIRLSKLHGILTPYTSYLILEEGQTVAGRPLPVPSPRAPGTLLQGAQRAVSDTLRPSSSGLEVQDAVGADAESARGEAKKLEGRLRGAANEADRAYRFSRGGAGSVQLSRRLKALKSGAASEELSANLVKELNRQRIRVRRVAGRVFYRQGARWIDSALTIRKLKKDEKLRVVKYLSDEYFKLLDEGAEMGKLLSLGAEVSFLWKDQLVSIDRS